MLDGGEIFGQPLQGAAGDGAGLIEEDQRGAEKAAEDERDGEVVGEQGGQHGDSQHGRAGQPIAGVGG